MAENVRSSSGSSAQRPRFRYPLARPRLGERERTYLLEAFDSGWISSAGEFILRFQREFLSYVGTRHGVATSNGTTAIHLALAASGVGAGDEVIVPDLTFVSPANMVLQTGAKPVLADSNKDYWGIDADAIKVKLTDRTKAVIVVHLYGHPVDLDPIVELCNSRNLVLIEDCAEAHGAMYKGRRVGSFGQISCFSFYGNKLLTTGEGGMCLTNDPMLEERMKLLRDHGADRKQHFWHPAVGFNYRMTNLQAAIGCAQLESLDERIEKYRMIGRAYASRLVETFGSSVTPHPEMRWALCVFWMYTLLIDSLDPIKRERLRSHLAEEGIETRPIFYPISKLPPYRGEPRVSDNPNAASISSRGISLPTYEGLERPDIDVIVDTLHELVASRL